MTATTGSLVTNGQRAAICGLILAGVPVTHACAIVSANPCVMRQYLPKDWRRRIVPRKRWTGELLEELKEAWDDRSQRTITIAERYGICVKQIHNIAVREGWSTRPRGTIPSKTSMRNQPRDMWLLYRKLKRGGLSHMEAQAEVLGQRGRL